MKLSLPPTLSFPAASDFPKGYDVAALVAEHAAARIERGYVLDVPTEPTGYAFFAKCNVDTDELWPVFERLTSGLPAQAGALVGFKDEDPRRFPYAARDEIMRVLSLFRRELTCDPFLQFGLIHQRHRVTEEVFVAPAKYVSIWGNDTAALRATMADLRLPEVPDLSFVDEFPLASVALRTVDPGALYFHDVFDAIAERLEALDA